MTLSKEAIDLFNEMLLEEIDGTIQGIDSSQDVSRYFLYICLHDRCFLVTAVESFFNDSSFDISQLKQLKDEVDDFQPEFNKLKRPYEAISDEHQLALSIREFPLSLLGA
ncbi:MAG: hypothetical protein GJ680_21180 [Alteromonadaceae bacterium]|nr:hypothetical protein [Alteromonadaceae bacterium]